MAAGKGRKIPSVEVTVTGFGTISTNRWSVAKGDTKYKYDPVGNLTNIVYAVPENGFAPVPAIHEVVDGPWILNSQFARHGTEDGINGPLCQ